MINFNQENISQSKKKNSKYKAGIDYNEENKRGVLFLSYTSEVSLG